MFKNIIRKAPMNFFVSIGAGINQIPLIKAARKNGFQVIGVDQNSSAPGFYYCDLKIQESIRDYENIYIKLRELLVDGKISAVMTKSYGEAIVTVSYLCEKFELNHIPFESAGKFMDKKAMSREYKKAEIETPTGISINSKTDPKKMKSEKFPLIVKPRTGHAKTDVRVLSKPSELSAFLKGKNANDYVFERIIDGDEIICSGLVVNGKYHNILITDKQTTPHPYFVDLIHTSPSKYDHKTDDINAIGQKIADTMEIINSPMIMEFIISEDKLYLLEAVPEFGGEFIPDVMVPNATGYTLIENSVRAFAGLKYRPISSYLQQSAIAVKYITGTKGTLKSFNTDAARSTPGLIFMKIFKDIGAEITSPISNHDRLGVIIGRARIPSKAIELCEDIEKKMNIRIENEQ